MSVNNIMVALHRVFIQPPCDFTHALCSKVKRAAQISFHALSSFFGMISEKISYLFGRKVVKEEHEQGHKVTEDALRAVTSNSNPTEEGAGAEESEEEFVSCDETQDEVPHPPTTKEPNIGVKGSQKKRRKYQSRHDEALARKAQGKGAKPTFLETLNANLAPPQRRQKKRR